MMPGLATTPERKGQELTQPWLGWTAEERQGWPTQCSPGLSLSLSLSLFFPAQVGVRRSERPLSKRPRAPPQGRPPGGRASAVASLLSGQVDQSCQTRSPASCHPHTRQYSPTRSLSPRQAWHRAPVWRLPREDRQASWPRRRRLHARGLCEASNAVTPYGSTPWQY